MAASNRHQFRRPIGPRFDGVDQRYDLVPSQRCLDLSKTGNGGTRLARQRQGRKSRIGEPSLNPTGETRFKLHRAAVRTGEEPTSLRGLDVIGPSRYPDSATRKPVPKIGHDIAVRRDNKTDQRVDRRGGAGDDAGPFCFSSTVRQGALIR